MDFEVSIGRHDSVEVWNHEGAVYLAIDSRDGRETVDLTVEQARSIANALVAASTDAVLSLDK